MRMTIGYKQERCQAGDQRQAIDFGAIQKTGQLAARTESVRTAAGYAPARCAHLRTGPLEQPSRRGQDAWERQAKRRFSRSRRVAENEVFDPVAFLRALAASRELFFLCGRNSGLSAERVTTDAQQPGGLGAAAAGGLERFFDETTFELLGRLCHQTCRLLGQPAPRPPPEGLGPVFVRGIH